MKLNLANVPAFEQRDSAAPGSILWSPQQSSVFEAVESPSRGSLRVDSVAGSGKTTTLVEAASRMDGRVAFAAFNKRIADEIKVRTRNLRNVQVGTMHSFGLRNWKVTAPDAQVNGDKLQDIVDDLRVPYPLQSFTKFMVGIAKQHGRQHPVSYDDWNLMAAHFDALDRLQEGWDADDDAFKWCNPVLKESIDRSQDIIDFDDMLYMPLVYGQIAADFDWVLVDEAQDTNNVRRRLIGRMARQGARVVAVGDPHQAIYGFTGADADAMDLISSDFSCEYLPLTVTYRCPKAVVAHARQWVSHITAAPEAPEGLVRNVSDEEWQQTLLAGPSDAFTSRDSILCRNTRPLVSLALQMIRRNIPARVEGRDIGQGLLTLAGKWKSASTLSKLQDNLETYLERETRKYLNRGQKSKAAQVEDKVSSLVAVIESLPSGSNIYDLRQRINSLFGDTEPGQPPKATTLSTVHKAKGREWDRVYLLGRNSLMPSKFAKQEWELEQENNLIYVAVTRAKRELVEVDYYG